MIVNSPDSIVPIGTTEYMIVPLVILSTCAHFVEIRQEIELDPICINNHITVTAWTIIFSTGKFGFFLPLFCPPTTSK